MHLFNSFAKLHAMVLNLSVLLLYFVYTLVSISANELQQIFHEHFYGGPISK